MDMTEYQIKAMETRLPTADADYAFLNLAAEAGEVCGALAKYIRDDDDWYEFAAKLKKELGDVLWHLAAICNDYQWTLTEIAEENLVKLASRQQRNVLQGSGDER